MDILNNHITEEFDKILKQQEIDQKLEQNKNKEIQILLNKIDKLKKQQINNYDLE